MGGFSLWHWVIVLLVLAVPVGLVFAIYVAVRTGVRHGMKDRDEQQP